MAAAKIIIGDPVYYWDERAERWQSGTVANVYDSGPQAPYYSIEGGGATLYSHRLVRPGRGEPPREPPALD